MKNTDEKQNRPAPLFGLIAAGGHSVRMGREKGGIAYGSRPQVQRLHRQLAAECRSVFVSIREDQSDRSWCDHLPQIHDLFRDMGPVSGLLSAMIRFPHAAWLFVGCDMPFVNLRVIRRLVKNRDPSRCATVYRRPGSNYFEPVFGIYEPAFRQTIRDALGRGTRSLHRMLENEDVRTVRARSGEVLTDVNRPSELHRVQRLFQR